MNHEDSTSWPSLQAAIWPLQESPKSSLRRTNRVGDFRVLKNPGEGYESHAASSRRSTPSIDINMTEFRQINAESGWAAQHGQEDESTWKKGMRKSNNSDGGIEWAEPHAISTDRPPPGERFPSSQETLSENTCRKRDILNEIWMSLCWILVSMLAILITFGVIIGLYLVKPKRGIFLDPLGWDNVRQRGYFILNIPSTWLTFVAARASQFAALLTGPLMQLWTWRTARSLVDASSSRTARDLPTPYQLSLLIGICMASIDRLRRWISYRVFRQQRHIASHSPPVLLRAGIMCAVFFCLASLMFGADTILHYTTSTVEYHMAEISTVLQQYGRGLSQECLQLNRIDNFGYPCSFDVLASADDFSRPRNEALNLFHNRSQASEVRSLAGQNQFPGDISLILPQTLNLSAYVDFEASTIGITSKCKSITPICNFGSWGPEGLYSGFYCGPNLYGALGKPINESGVDPDIPPLAYRFASNLIISFFTDGNLSVPYNTVGYNPETGEADPDIPAWPDDKLINEVHFAVAVRFASSAVSAGTNFTSDPGFYKGPAGVYDAVLGCSYQSVNVDYTWFNGSVKEYQANPVKNGSISEIWHGSHMQNAVSSESPALQGVIDQAQMESTSAEFAQTFANLYSTVVMAATGGYTSGRANLAQQTRTPMLVTKVWIPALVFIVFICLLYLCAGCSLATLAVMTGPEFDLRDVVSRLSLWGIVNWAARLTPDEPVGLLPKEAAVELELSRIGFSGDPVSGCHFLVNPAPREVVEF